MTPLLEYYLGYPRISLGLLGIVTMQLEGYLGYAQEYWRYLPVGGLLGISQDNLGDTFLLEDYLGL